MPATLDLLSLPGSLILLFMKERLRCQMYEEIAWNISYGVSRYIPPKNEGSAKVLEGVK